MAGEELGTAPDVRFPPPAVFLGFIFLGILIDWAFRLPEIPAGGYLPMLGVGLIGAGAVLLLVSLGLFGASGENPEPWTTSEALIARGPYRHTRNPMYVAMAAIHLGFALWNYSMGIALTLPFAVLAIDRFVIAREEVYLTRRFGKAYTDYTARVRRWL